MRKVELEDYAMTTCSILTADITITCWLHFSYPLTLSESIEIKVYEMD